MLAIVLLAGCQQDAPTRSQLFDALIQPDQGQFRSHSLGQSLAEVRKAEPLQPTLEDEWGLVYDLPLAGVGEATLEYFAYPTDSTKLLAGMVANISLPGEVEASQLYRELQDWLDARYEVPDGRFGNYRWEVPAENTEVVLRLMDSKTAISLNYYRPQQTPIAQ
jgi:hypothetical protein